VLGLLVAVTISHVANGRPEEAVAWGFQFSKIAVYFLLLVAVVNTPDRLHQFVGWIGVLIVATAALGLLEFHGFVDLPALAAIDPVEIDPVTAERSILPRLCGAGIFNDPNDLSIILVVGLVIGVTSLGAARVYRVFWAGAIVLLAYSLTLTQSRGGLLTLMAGCVGLTAGWLGLRRAALLGAPLAIGMAMVVGGRMANFDVGNADDTSQHRIRLWRDGLVLFTQQPVLGIGPGRYEEECGLVAHNSFVHAFTELGFFGGTLFLAAFLYPMRTLYRAGRPECQVSDDRLRSLAPCILACTLAMAAGMLSLSRNYTLPPYLVLGVVTVYLRLVIDTPSLNVPRLTGELAARATALGGTFVGCAYVFVRLFALNV
jgi:hypothetical protein